MKFEYRNGLLYLPISVFYDTSVELIGIIDTGSAGTAVEVGRFNIDLLSRNGRAITLHGVGGTQDAFAQTVSSVRIGEFEARDFEIEFRDLKDDFGFEAVVGSDLLDKLGAVIDYGKREINFST
jgi:hypothetical protein